MRKRLGTWGATAVLACAMALGGAPQGAYAQKKDDKPAKDAKDPKKDAKAPAKKGEVIDLDEEDEDGDPKKKAAYDDGPVTAGQMTEEAAQAKRLFDAERWSEAALALKRVVAGDT